ncbi:outer membrane beta-barrel family protein [Pedobacter aquatilis]|uniref:outer membrane beta-barrel protein n=1 Tax=Pedobacter aquatilis TaxID=351343 RepID=UPI0025B5A775|nr:outer membrane beta-barrel family protein [Pedobacter aquatilis]MDN3585600.1 outer membrane beta-barrel family protein [Pedobacter aquatilis]
MKIYVRRAIFLVLIFCGYFAQAQNGGAINGRVINAKDKKPVDYATIAVKSLKDSSIVASGQSNPDGTFSFKNIPAGNYRVIAAFLGLKTTNKNITVAKAAVNVGDIAMDDDGLNLNDVNVTAQVPTVVVKKDTLEYDAKSVKVRENAVVEDVLKKLPGVEVAKDGSIKAGGETVTRVKVDGKEFFGSDPLLATKNLPADMVDKIQVIDELSEQAQFTGVDDGTRSKILNITTKSGMKKGYFGNSTVGYGTNDRYDASLNVNKFDNDQQFSFIGQFNNVNKQNFGGGGGQGNGFGGGGNGGRGFGGGGGNTTSGGGGITTTNAAGLNFGDTYKDGTQIQGSYFFNKASVFNEQTSNTQTLLGNSSQNVNNYLNSNSDRTNHRFNFMIDTKLDSTTSIKIQPNVAYTENSGLSLQNYNRNNVIASGITNTVGNQNFTTDNSTPVITNNILVRKKFKRRGRTLSLNINTSINDSDSDNINYILENSTINGATTQKLTNQLNDLSSSNISNTTRVVYTEPLSKTTSLELNYQNGIINSTSDRNIFNFNTATGNFDLVDNTYSNHFENQTLTNAAGVSYTVTQKKYNWNIGVAGQQTNRENTNLTTGVVFTQNFINLTPSAQFRYNFSNSKRLFINYRGTTQQPTIDQIQPIPDNTNTQSVILGNPDLKPAFNNTLSVRYNNFAFAKMRFFAVFLNLTQTFNAFASSQSVITNPADINYGKIASTFINVDGNYSGNANVVLGQPILPNNKLNLNATLGGNFSRGTNITSGIDNITNNWSLTNNYRFVTNLDKLDLTAGIGGTVTRATYSATPNSNTRFFTLNPSFDVSYLFPGNIRLAVDLDYMKNTGRGEGFNTDFTLVNAYVSRQFFKNRGTFKLSVNDALNQNQGISRTATANTITDLNYNVLKRYYMFSFTYSLTRIGGRNIGNDVQMPGMGGGAPRMRF